MENNTLCNRHSLGVNNHTKMYVTYTRIYGWSDYGGESSYQPGYRLENMMWMTLLVYDYIIPGDKMSKIKVLFICHGNICRSTMAESVMTYLVEKEGLADKFYINSAATSREEIGNGVHHGTVAKLKKEGIPVIPHRAVQMTLNDYEEYDYLIGMDTENIRNMQRISGGDPDEKIYKLLTFAGSGLDVADPWYTGDFEATYRDVLAGCKGLLECLKEEL